MDIQLAKSHMALRNECVPHGNDHFDWAHAPAVVMGCNATEAGLPSWWTGPRHPTWPRVLSWFTVYREAGSLATVNSRVQVKDLALYVKSKASGQWVLMDLCPNPEGSDYQEDKSEVVQSWNSRPEPDGGRSLRPPKGYCSHGWGVTKMLDVADIAGVYVEMQFRAVADDKFNEDTRLTDRWCVNVGIDYYPPAGATPKAVGPCLSGRYLKALPDWRVATGIALPA